MKLLTTLCAVVTAASGLSHAAELQSGLEPGDIPPAFYVSDVTGPSAGDPPLCYRCRYSDRPVVAVFTRDIDEHTVELLKQLDTLVAKNAEDRMAAFVVLLSDRPDQHAEKLKAVAKEHKLTNVPLTTYPKSAGPRRYHIHKEAELSVMMWVDNNVKVNQSFRKDGVTSEAVQQVVASTDQILE